MVAKETSRSSAGLFPSLACATVGLAGVAQNLIAATIAPSENILGVFVLLSMLMMLVGYLPEITKWKNRKWAIRIVNVAIGSYVIYVLLTVALMGS